MLKKTLLAISIISVLFIVFFSTLFSQIYNINYYEKKYEKYNVYDRFSDEEARSATLNLFDFFRSKAELTDFFNENEKSHLNDVRIILQNTQQLYYLAITLFWIILLIFYLFIKKDFMNFFSNLLFYSGITIIGLIIIFSLIYLITGFDFLFTKFHEMFFTGNYVFDPNISNMKALFPDEFFRDFAFIVILKSSAKALLLSLFGFFIRKKFI